MKRRIYLLLLAAALAPLAHAQFELFRVNGNVEVTVPPLYDFGSVYSGETVSTQFRLRNTSSTPAVLGLLKVAGVGFTLAGPMVPLSVAPSTAVDFTVTFLAAMTGSYSAPMDVTGVSVLLTATVAPSLTYTVALPAGWQQLSTAPVDFGLVPIGSPATLRFTAANQTGIPLIVPAIAVQGGYFALSGVSPSGTVLQSQQQAAFDVQFAPLAGGTSAAALAIGDRAYSLTGTAPAPPLPAPVLSISLPQPQSAQQGSLTVNLDAAAPVSGGGTVTLAFQPAVAGATDSAIAFAAGGGTLTFTFARGDTQAYFGDRTSVPFQTGTTAGTLAFTATLGETTVRQSVSVAAAQIGVSDVQGSRAAGTVQVQIAGYDNTRSAGQLVFTFFDASDNPITPGGIHSDNTRDFANYFSTSDLGGIFLLKALFPVSGDTSQIRSVEVQLINFAGTTKSARIGF
jgi:hypothetical protein